MQTWKDWEEYSRKSQYSPYSNVKTANRHDDNFSWDLFHIFCYIPLNSNLGSVGGSVILEILIIQLHINMCYK